MHSFAPQFTWIAVAMLAAAVFGALAKRVDQPRVLGALIAGIVIGVFGTGTHFMEELRSEHGIPLISGLAEVAACLLLFKAGLEGNLNTIIQDAKVGWRVAVIGIIVPVAGGTVFTFYAFDAAPAVAFFQGGVFAATSVGITAAVLDELGVINQEYSKSIISAAVIDDVLGLFILTLCSALNAAGEFSITHLVGELAWAVAFVIVIPMAGHLYAGRILSMLNRIDEKAREAVVLGFMLAYAAAAMYAGLAAIVGAYFAGVALEEAYFLPEGTEKNSHDVEHFIDQLITGFGPIFFVYAGCIVNPAVFLHPTVLCIGIAFTAIAMAGKLACGLVVPKGQRMIVGFGMSPRGEVGIIFATIGLSSHILTQEMFGASMIMVLLTTMLTPPLLNAFIPKEDREQALSPAHA